MARYRGTSNPIVIGGLCVVALLITVTQNSRMKSNFESACKARYSQLVCEATIESSHGSCKSQATKRRYTSSGTRSSVDGAKYEACMMKAAQTNERWRPGHGRLMAASN